MIEIYPPLSADVDYTVLTDKDEWNIIYNYIFIYPSIIKETCQLSNANNTSVVSSGCKKLSQFLIKLCHAFSRYYSRVKILMVRLIPIPTVSFPFHQSPEPDLIPLIQARLMLVLTLKQVLADGLKLLQINPLNEL
jgi:arginyl-tRNA synthetase